ncbi:MAG: type I 3-dehydroquinate dehydratase [Phycisphaerales bacterium]|nr:type I 3-dehydroquinate dehydratase [Phycisphaerales bacterium]
MPTLLCVPIMVESVDRARAEAIRAAELGADLVEFRIDQFFSGSEDQAEVLRLVAGSPLPCIVTCRPTWEGGHYDGDEDQRVSLYEALGAAAHPPAYIDAELGAYTRSANERQKLDLAVDHPGQHRDVRTRLILSSHDFAGRPNDLTRRMLAMQAEPGASVCKAAFRARSLRDNLELFDILTERTKPTIALGMGEFGLASRVLAPKFGAFLTFASLRDEAATAPGQPTITDLLDRYRFRSIGPATKVYGIVGWPVGHSMSPLIHNAGFAEIGHDGVYLPLPIAVGEDGAGAYESFKATMLELVHHPRLDLAGCSVTMPHKENLVRLAREQAWTLDEVASGSGAANTLAIRRAPSGSVTGASVANTDAAAAVGCLAAALGSPRGRPVVVLGAGGVARAIAFGLGAAGAVVTVTNRSPDRADRLAADINHAFPDTARAIPWSDRAAAQPDAYINCTSIGMQGGPAPDDSPLPPQALARANITLLETVYNPVRTRLLSQARDAGWRTIDGVTMFVDQGARQFELWTSHPAPRDRFDRLVRDALSR